MEGIDFQITNKGDIIVFLNYVDKRVDEIKHFLSINTSIKRMVDSYNALYYLSKHNFEIFECYLLNLSNNDARKKPLLEKLKNTNDELLKIEEELMMRTKKPLF